MAEASYSEIKIDVEGEVAVKVMLENGLYVDTNSIDVKRSKKDSNFTISCAIPDSSEEHGAITKSVEKPVGKRTLSLPNNRLTLPPVDLFHCAWLRTRPGRRHQMQEKKVQLDTRLARQRVLEPISPSPSEEEISDAQHQEETEGVAEGTNALDPLELFNTPRSQETDILETAERSGRSLAIKTTKTSVINALDGRGRLIEKNVVLYEYKEIAGQELGNMNQQ